MKTERRAVSARFLRKKGANKKPPKMEFMTQVYMIGMPRPTMAVFLKSQSHRNHGCSVRESKSLRTRMLRQSEAEGLSLESRSLVRVCVQRLKKLEPQEVGIREGGSQWQWQKSQSLERNPVSPWELAPWIGKCAGQLSSGIGF